MKLADIAETDDSETNVFHGGEERLSPRKFFGRNFFLREAGIVWVPYPEACFG
jgi:hypothetical protein